MGSLQHDAQTDIEYTRFVNEVVDFDAALDSSAIVEQTDSSPSTYAGIHTPDSSHLSPSANSDKNWSTSGVFGSVPFREYAPQSVHLSSSSNGSFHQGSTVSPTELQNQPSFSTQHDVIAAFGLTEATRGSELNKPARSHALAQGIPTLDDSQYAEWTGFLSNHVQDPHAAPQQGRSAQQLRNGSSPENPSLQLGNVASNNSSSGHAISTKVLPDPAVPRGVTLLNLQVRNEHEAPWSAFSMAHNNASQFATSAAPPHRHYAQAEAPPRRVSASGAIMRPQPRGLRPAEVSIRRANAIAESVASPTPATNPSPSTARQRYGGRNGGLTKAQQEAAMLMRELKSCWQCALQRVKCDEGRVCKGCAERMSRRPAHTLGCVRTVLTEMINTFIPMRMTQVHDPAVVELSVKGSMTGWVSNDGYQGLTVNLTVGYGPVLSMDLHEFTPRTHEVVCQLQWIKDGNGEVKCTRKESPPLAIKGFKGHNNESFKERVSYLHKYIDTLIETHLHDFEEIYCADQEDDPFRASLMRLLCKLFREAPHDSGGVSLREDLKAALRSIIATDIMLHNLTLERSSQDWVVSKLLDSRFNNPSAYKEYTSPKLVNRQFKALISSLQESFCHDVLLRMHNILRTAKGDRRKRTWLSTFVLTLAMAMCQEELEHNRYLRADGEVNRGEQDAGPAFTQARADCRSADKGFDFLLTLFHYKYSPPKHHVASLRDWAHVYNNDAERQFLLDLVVLTMPYQAILLQRKGLEVSSTTKLYKSRLVARFFTGFMGLDREVSGLREFVSWSP